MSESYLLVLQELERQHVASTKHVLKEMENLQTSKAEQQVGKVLNHQIDLSAVRAGGSEQI